MGGPYARHTSQAFHHCAGTLQSLPLSSHPCYLYLFIITQLASQYLSPHTTTWLQADASYGDDKDGQTRATVQFVELSGYGWYKIKYRFLGSTGEPGPWSVALGTVQVSTASQTVLILGACLRVRCDMSHYPPPCITRVVGFVHIRCISKVVDPVEEQRKAIEIAQRKHAAHRCMPCLLLHHHHSTASKYEATLSILYQLRPFGASPVLPAVWSVHRSC